MFSFLCFQFFGNIFYVYLAFGIDVEMIQIVLMAFNNPIHKYRNILFHVKNVIDGVLVILLRLYSG